MYLIAITMYVGNGTSIEVPLGTSIEIDFSKTIRSNEKGFFTKASFYFRERCIY